MYRHIVVVLIITVGSVIGCCVYFMPITQHATFNVELNEPISKNYTDYFYDFYGYDVDLSNQLPYCFTAVGIQEIRVNVGPFVYPLVFNVSDTKQPIVTIESLVVEQKDDIESLIQVKDDSDYTIEVSMEKINSQWMSHGFELAKVTYQVSDEFNNETYGEFVALITNGQEVGKTLGLDYDQPLADIIDDYLTQYGLNKANLAYVYYNLITEESVVLNENRYQVAASTYKLPLNMVYCDLLEKGEISLTDQVVYEKKDYEIGAGYLETNHSIGDKINIKELMQESLFWSNNTASRMLYKYLGGFESFKNIASDYAKNLGYEQHGKSNLISVNYLLACLKRIYRNQDTYDMMIDILAKASEDNYGRYTSKIPMMHKYGHYDTALNDCGIVFGPIPFAFVILSESMSEIDVGNIVNIMVLYTLNHPGELSLDYNGSNK